MRHLVSTEQIERAARAAARELGGDFCGQLVLEINVFKGGISKVNAHIKQSIEIGGETKQ